MRVTLLPLLRRVAPLPEPIFEFGAYRWDEFNATPAAMLQQPVTGCDLLPGPGVDRIADLHALDIPDGTIGTALLMDTVEHVGRPWRALEEVHRVLRPGGVVLMTSHMYFPIHACPQDYWRFTGSGFQELLAPFEQTHVATAGLRVLPHTVAGLGIKGPAQSAPADVARLIREIDEWARTDANGWKERVFSLLPPAVVGPAYGAYRRVWHWVNNTAPTANEVGGDRRAARAPGADASAAD